LLHDALPHNTAPQTLSLASHGTSGTTKFTKNFVLKKKPKNFIVTTTTDAATASPHIELFRLRHNKKVCVCERERETSCAYDHRLHGKANS
jgi:hypothetical protein